MHPRAPLAPRAKNQLVSHPQDRPRPAPRRMRRVPPVRRRQAPPRLRPLPSASHPPAALPSASLPPASLPSASHPPALLPSASHRPDSPPPASDSPGTPSPDPPPAGCRGERSGRCLSLRWSRLVVHSRVHDGTRPLRRGPIRRRGCDSTARKPGMVGHRSRRRVPIERVGHEVRRRQPLRPPGPIRCESRSGASRPSRRGPRNRARPRTCASASPCRPSLLPIPCRCSDGCTDNRRFDPAAVLVLREPGTRHRADRAWSRSASSRIAII